MATQDTTDSEAGYHRNDAGPADPVAVEALIQDDLAMQRQLLNEYRSTSLVLGLLLAILALVAAGCAGSTVGSGVGDRTLERPPYYAGTVPVTESPLFHLPIQYQRGATDAPMFDPAAGEGTPVASMLAAMNAFLDSLAVSRPLLLETPAPGSPPDVQFRCENSVGRECESGDPTEVPDRPAMHLSVTRGSAEWAGFVAHALTAAGNGRTLLITVELADYWPRQRGLLGNKEVELGTGYSASLPWLTATDAPVRVLQLTGALLDDNGKPVRIGAEGMLARRTNLLAGAVGARRLITDDDILAAMEARREDLTGQPLVWKVALQNLVAGLIGQPQLAVR